ncbi:MAG TPA: 30S ribosomal protein S20 [Armatimonadota bacterium]|jgi:small subunit ribosomal protein S20
MPNIKSVKKDVKKSRERRLRNQSAKSALKTWTKKTRTAIEANQVDDAKELLRMTVKLLDTTAQKGIIHKNAAARRKSRLAKRLNKTAAPAQA